MSAHDRQTPLKVSASQLSGVHKVADSLKVDINLSLRQVGLNAQTIENPSGYITVHQFIDFLNDAARRFNCPQFGFLLAKEQGIRDFGQLTLLVKCSPTIGKSIASAISHGLLYSEQSAWDLGVANGYAALTRRDREMHKNSMTQLHEYAITATYNALRDMAGNKWRASSISFMHSRPKSATLYRRYFEIPVHFDQAENGIVFPEEDLDRPIPTADSQLLKIVESHLTPLLTAANKSSSIADSVELHIRRTLGLSICNLESIAEHLGHNSRSLQRALKHDNTTFRQLLNNVRVSMAKHYLRDSTITLTELADLLGYRNVKCILARL